MASLTTARVGLNQQTIVPGPVGGADADQALIINLDLENTVNLGSSSTNLSFPLGPLASATLTAPVYAAAATEPLEVGIAPGGSSYSPGSLTITGPVTAEITGTVTVAGTVDIAAGDVTFTNDQIDVTGIGGYILPGPYAVLISDSATHTIPVSGGAAGAGQYATAIQDVRNYQSFNLAIEASCPSQSGAAAPLVMAVTLSWFADAAGDFLVESDTYWMWLANSSSFASNYPLRGGGPAKGAYVVIGVANLGTGATIDVSQITLIGNGRAISQARFNQPPPYAHMSSGLGFLPTVNEAVIALSPGYPDGSDGILCNESQNAGIVAGDSYWLPLPLYTGPVSCRFSTSVALGSDFVLCTSAPLWNGNVAPGGGAQGIIWNPGNTAATEYTATLQLGNAPTYAVFKGGASAPTITLEIQGVAD